MKENKWKKLKKHNDLEQDKHKMKIKAISEKWLKSSV